MLIMYPLGELNGVKYFAVYNEFNGIILIHEQERRSNHHGKKTS